ncbi:MAG TPA: FliM/FliN family flagellar motor switch protein [Planctomycetaceae bacterium]|nr:FliM/FliN family flagellar motor switch protein [Planctomycetaceae bacterium]
MAEPATDPTDEGKIAESGPMAPEAVSTSDVGLNEPDAGAPIVPPATARSTAAAFAPSAPPESPSRIDRLKKLPVPVIVKLAEKRIEMGQLLGIGPGAIITFEKSCEDLLDFYVNNQLYCRGEAVKIGEKFGIKICEVGSMHERLSAVLSAE